MSATKRKFSLTLKIKYNYSIKHVTRSEYSIFDSSYNNKRFKENTYIILEIQIIIFITVIKLQFYPNCIFISNLSENKMETKRRNIPGGPYV